MLEKRELVSDTIEITAKTALSVIPVGGTLVSCVWDSVKGHVAQKRLDEWKQLIEERLHILDSTLEDIGNNEVFASVMMRATETAIKTSEKEKRIYLANAVKNSIDVEISESVVMMYMDMIEEYTAWHMKVLIYFRNPLAIIKSNPYSMGTAMEPLLQAFPEMIGHQELVDKIVNDMQTRGLLTKGNYLHTTMTGKGMIDARITNFGREFLEFLN